MKCRGRYTSEVIPTGLVIEILSRLPAKSIARCRCVSKPWASMLGRPYFTNYFVAKSCGRPQILFTCRKQGELFFFSTPQVQNKDDNSSPVTVSYLMKFVSDAPSLICDPVGGLVYLTHAGVFKGKKKSIAAVICNPSTGQSLTLPAMKTKNNSFLGYDPIDNEYKVLFITSPDYGSYEPKSNEYRILTLGARKQSWKTGDCGTSHYPLFHTSVCINGVLYYLALNKSSGTALIVSFDVRSENFRFIIGNEDMRNFSIILVNYKGKLASLSQNGLNHIPSVTGETGTFEMWVLEDEEKFVWSKHVFELPPVWKNVGEEFTLYFVGVTGTNEIVLYTRYLSNPFFVFYYNIDSKTIRRVEIQGMDASKLDYGVRASINHVEDVKLMEMFRAYNLRSRKRS